MGAGSSVGAGCCSDAACSSDMVTDFYLALLTLLSFWGHGVATEPFITEMDRMDIGEAWSYVYGIHKLWIVRKAEGWTWGDESNDAVSTKLYHSPRDLVAEHPEAKRWPWQPAFTPTWAAEVVIRRRDWRREWR